MIQENMVVYESLKNSALHCEDGISNARLQMYTVYFVMLPFSFAYHGIFLVIFIVLIAFQTIINTEKIAIERISSYIQVFFEEKRDDIHWSLLNKDSIHLDSYSKQYKNLGWYINIYTSSILAVISLVSMIAVHARQSLTTPNIPISVWIQIGLVFILCIVSIVVNRRYYDYKTGRKMISALDKSIQDFYERKCEEIIKKHDAE